MVKHINETLTHIFKENLPAPEAQKNLETIEPGDVDNAISRPDMHELFKQFEAKHPVKTGPIVHASEAARDRIWQAAVRNSRKKAGESQFKHWIETVRTWMSERAGQGSERSRGLAYAVILLVCLVPALTYLGPFHLSDSTGLKGVNLTTQKAYIDYSIVDSEPRLIRPDRPLTVDDTIAFRIELEEPRYCSVYMVFEGKIDELVSNQLYSKGIHDMGTGYMLTGNRGKNMLVLVSSEKPMKHAPSRVLPIIQNAEGIKTATVEVDRTRVDLISKQFDVK